MDGGGVIDRFDTEHLADTVRYLAPPNMTFYGYMRVGKFTIGSGVKHTANSNRDLLQTYGQGYRFPVISELKTVFFIKQY